MPCDWLSILGSIAMSVLRAGHCRLGMRFSVGTNANTQKTDGLGWLGVKIDGLHFVFCAIDNRH